MLAVLDAVLSDDGEDGQEIGEDEEVADLFAEVAKLQRAALVAGGDGEADKGAETHRVHLGEAVEIEDDALVAGEEIGDGLVEEVGGGREKLAAAEGDEGGGVVLEGEGEERGGGFGLGWHGFSGVGRTITLQVDQRWAAAGATQEQAADFVVGPHRTDLWWPSVDEGHYLPSLVDGRFGTAKWIERLQRRGVAA